MSNNILNTLGKLVNAGASQSSGGGNSSGLAHRITDAVSGQKHPGDQGYGQPQDFQAQNQGMYNQYGAPPYNTRPNQRDSSAQPGDRYHPQAYDPNQSQGRYHGQENLHEQGYNPAPQPQQNHYNQEYRQYAQAGYHTQGNFEGGYDQGGFNGNHVQYSQGRAYVPRENAISHGSGEHRGGYAQNSHLASHAPSQGGGNRMPNAPHYGEEYHRNGGAPDRRYQEHQDHQEHQEHQEQRANDRY